jgi:hypothetical protein
VKLTLNSLAHKEGKMKRKQKVVIGVFVAVVVVALGNWWMSVVDRKEANEWLDHMHSSLVTGFTVYWGSAVQVECDSINNPFQTATASNGQGFWAQWVRASEMMLDTHPTDNKKDLCVARVLWDLHLAFADHESDSFFASPSEARELNERVLAREHQIYQQVFRIFAPEE